MKKNKKENYREFKKEFKQLIENNVPVFDSVGNQLVIEPDEIFLQCYKDGDPVKSIFAPYYFLSNKGNLVSLARKKPLWVKKNKRKIDGREFYVIVTTKGKHITRSVYALVAIVFDAETFGLADKFLNERGVYAFGRQGNLFALNVHHKEDLKNHPEKAYLKENLQIATSEVHYDVVEAAPKHDVVIEEIIKYAKEFTDIMEKESPEKVNIVWSGEKININSGEWSNSASSIHACTPEEINVEDFVETLKEHPFTLYVPLNDGSGKYAMLWVEATEDGKINIVPVYNTQGELETVTL